MKGVILAGGSGTRLHPLTRITNKHLLPIYDRPMVSYAIEALVQSGVDELMLVTGGTHAGEFLRLLGNGHEYGIERLSYGYQEEAGGIAEALGLRRKGSAKRKSKRRNDQSCEDCFFHRRMLCALDLDAPCSTFRADSERGLGPPRQPALLVRDAADAEPVAT